MLMMTRDLKDDKWEAIIVLIGDIFEVPTRQYLTPNIISTH